MNLPQRVIGLKGTPVIKEMSFIVKRTILLTFKNFMYSRSVHQPPGSSVVAANEVLD